MLAGYVLGAFAYGLAKGRAVARSDEPLELGFETASALAEELEARVVLGDFIAQRALGMSFSAATALSSAVFGLSHITPGRSADVQIARVAETALAGVAYSIVYAKYGLLGAVATHLAHNLGAHAGMNR